MAEIDIPHYFLCPITLDIMRDPVTVATGITYDRESIEKWLFTDKNTTCPSTKQLIGTLELTPNITLRRLIQSWCTINAANGVERLPTPKAAATRPQILKLLRDAAARPHMQSDCLRTLKSIAAENQTNRRVMESAGAAEFLAALIIGKAAAASDEDLSDFRKISDEALSIIHTLQLTESGIKPLITLKFVEALTLILNCGSYESRSYAIVLLKSMVETADPSLITSLETNFFSEIARILNDNVSEKASKSALKLLIAACPCGGNKIKAVAAGVVATLIDILLESAVKRTSEMIMTVLDTLCRCADGRAELLKHGGGLAVVSRKIMRVSPATSERAVRILHSISRFSATAGVLVEMVEVGVVAKLCLLLQVDCGSKTKERASEILKRHANAWRNSSCIAYNLISLYPS